MKARSLWGRGKAAGRKPCGLRGKMSAGNVPFGQNLGGSHQFGKTPGMQLSVFASSLGKALHVA